MTDDVETENTFRALKDEDPLITSWLCRWGWHRWTQWSNPYIPKNGKCNIQHSTCDCCNTMRIRRLVDQNGSQL